MKSNQPLTAEDYRKGLLMNKTALDYGLACFEEGQQSVLSRINSIQDKAEKDLYEAEYILDCDITTSESLHKCRNDIIRFKAIIATCKEAKGERR